MKTTAARIRERRRAQRKDCRIPALAGAKRAKPFDCENAVVEEMGSGNARIRSARPLREKDSVLLYVGEGKSRRPYHTKVVWAREDGFIGTRKMGKPGPAYLAGCRLTELKESNLVGKSVQSAGKKALHLSVNGIPLLVRAAIYALGIGLAGTTLYGLISLSRLLR